MNLRDYYNALPDATFPKSDFYRKVIEHCKVTKNAVYKWLTGETKPHNQADRQFLSELTGIPVEDLWS